MFRPCRGWSGSPVGELLREADDHALTGITFCADTLDGDANHPLLAAAARQLAETIGARR